MQIVDRPVATAKNTAGLFVEGPAPILSVRNASIFFGNLQATNGVAFDVHPKERVGVVGESGCGKSITGLSILGLLPPTSRVEGSIEFEGRNLLTLGHGELRKVRGRKIGMIFQEPMSALDPVFTIGQQIGETIRAHFNEGRKAVRERGIDVLARVGIPDPRRRYDEYPHQLSGGMRQRAMIAMALACEPKLLIADEPTTALDVTIQAQIMDLLLEVSERTEAALLLITHDLGVVAETCTRMLTMYAGQVVEDAPVDEALAKPRHPYTSGLLRSIPRLSERGAPLPSIPGRVPTLSTMPRGCRFQPRCGFARPPCDRPQAMQHVDAHQSVRCCRHTELQLEGSIQ